MIILAVLLLRNRNLKKDRGVVYMEVILFGASKMGEIAYEKLKDNCNIVAFVDNNKNKQGAIFFAG